MAGWREQDFEKVVEKEEGIGKSPTTSRSSADNQTQFVFDNTKLFTSRSMKQYTENNIENTKLSRAKNERSTSSRHWRIDQANSEI